MNHTVVSYSNENFSFKWELPACLFPSTKKEVPQREVGCKIGHSHLNKNSHLNRTPLYFLFYFSLFVYCLRFLLKNAQLWQLAVLSMLLNLSLVHGGGGSAEAGIAHAAVAGTAYTTPNWSESPDPFLRSQHETAQMTFRLNKHTCYSSWTLWKTNPYHYLNEYSLCHTIPICLLLPSVLFCHLTWW